MTEMQGREFDLDVEAELDLVWDALTTSAGLASWYVVAADVDLQPGGKLTVDWGVGPVAMGEFDVIEAPQRLRLIYREGGGAPTGAEEWLLSHDNGVTHVRLIHSLPVEPGSTWDDTYPGIVRGWSLFMGTLAFVVERHGRLGRAAEVRVGDIEPGAWEGVLGVLGLAASPVPGGQISLPEAGPADVVVSVDGFSLLFAVDDTATLLIDVEGDSLYTVAATYGPAAVASDVLRGQLVAIAEAACRAASGS